MKILSPSEYIESPYAMSDVAVLNILSVMKKGNVASGVNPPPLK